MAKCPSTEDGSALRERVAAAIYERNNPGFLWRDAHPDDRACYGNDADAALTVFTPVVALYERWTKAGPPPLGTPMARWWDARLVEMRNAILPASDQPEGQ